MLALHTSPFAFSRMGCGCSDENHEEHPPNLNQFKFGTSNQTMMRIEREGEKAAENVPDAKCGEQRRLLCLVFSLKSPILMPRARFLFGRTLHLNHLGRHNAGRSLSRDIGETMAMEN